MLLRLLLVVATTSLGPLCAQQQTDIVAVGRKVFESIGCSTCHAVAAADDSLRTGPNLYGLFLSQPRERVVMAKGKPKTVLADRRYFERSLRNSWDELAIAERGALKGNAYQAAMPVYVEDLLALEQVEALWHYLRTCADEDQRGPEQVLRQTKQAKKPKQPLDIPGEEIVAKRTRVMRAPLGGTSARAVHVGQPNGMSFTFDPRMLSVRRVWTGGFLNLHEERSARGRELSSPGEGAKLYVDGIALLAPLAANGTRIDFEFKEPDAHDEDAIERHLWDPRDFQDKLAAVDAEFRGYRVDPALGTPTFRFRVGRNEFAQTITIDDTGRITIELTATLREPQRFRVRELPKAEVSAGELGAGVWNLPAGEQQQTFTLAAALPGGVIARALVDRQPDRSPQPLRTRPAEPGKCALEVPAGYRVEDWLAPLDGYGREQLFEPTGIAVAKDGTMVFATRTAGLWRIRNGQWTQFAEGLYEALGVVIEDDHGDVLVIAQKPELTRLRDSDGDGQADEFETLCDDYGFHGNYHEYTHGPVRDDDGSYYFLLNLSHGGDERVSWRAGGPFMGSMGGYRGFACRVTKDGVFERYAMGLRSPAGFGRAPDGRFWYAENQGEYVGSSKWVPLERGAFYGHPSGLVTLPGMTPYSEELRFENWRDKIRKGAVWLPHGTVANSPGNPAWDLTEGRFGAYAGPVFCGDQTLSQLLRIVTEQIDGKDQGCVVPFARGLQSGIMRPCFLADGSLLLGQTGRGWGARGGSRAALQRLVYDGMTVAADIHHVHATPTGFAIRFTQPLAKGVDGNSLLQRLQVRSWFYTNTGRYGSPQHEKRDDVLVEVRIDEARTTATLTLQGCDGGVHWADRVYRISIEDTGGLFGDAGAWPMLEAFYTRR
jgi:mono/diheme cytochrome c family protein